ncbi:MAG TPA: riboflavin biosynthesis protein RibF [Gemmataceae bacterium]|nr:riboflavin biosynthesis protein RibF [Gemmataceae bacterium]
MAILSVRTHDSLPAYCQGGAVTIGNFDGVHRGHQALLAELRRQADLVGGPAVAMTFDPPPSRLLRPGFVPAALTTLADRTTLMLAHGAEHVLVMQTTHDLLQRTAREFFDGIIKNALATKALVPGFNFAFGHNREGTVTTVTAMCHDAAIKCVPVPPLQIDGQPVSSSRIRGELLAGNVSAAANLLGRWHRVIGNVVVGQRRGQTLGFPTANLDGVATLVPGNGVYVVRVHHQGGLWSGATNVGPNPTFGEVARKIEVHLLDFSGDLYGATLAVDFLQRLRDTHKFAGPGELANQLTADIAATRRIVQGIGE